MILKVSPELRLPKHAQIWVVGPKRQDCVGGPKKWDPVQGEGA